MFRWHSTVVQPNDGIARHGTSSASTSAPAPSTDATGPSIEERCIQHGFDLCQSVGERAKRDADGKLVNPAAFLSSVEGSGIKFGPQGGGTLLAIADMRRPTLEEFTRCARMPGSIISGRKPLEPPRPGRGLGHLHSSSQGRGGGASGPPRGRSGVGMGGSMGRQTQR
uniref:Uncharacterized protein n=1 Tax=Haptolina brevifila TaxID=156173 RepID=A0A7S2IVB3_9EUKA|mmetsp:Transcript_71860/g.142452  ORF Transcript_71860/g.142452 Transcript_71860/m.142452 type:complete len:168 (+) Transcript_71860:65-568(+)